MISQFVQCNRVPCTHAVLNNHVSERPERSTVCHVTVGVSHGELPDTASVSPLRAVESVVVLRLLSGEGGAG